MKPWKDWGVPRAAECGFSVRFETPISVYTTAAERRGLCEGEVFKLVEGNPLYMQVLRRHVSYELAGAKAEHVEREVWRHATIATEALALVEQVLRLVELVALGRHYEDWLTVDDYFLMVIEPPCAEFVWALQEIYGWAAARDSVSWRIARLSPNELAEVQRIEECISEAWPLVNVAPSLDDHAKPPCWHSGGHDRWRRRGRTTNRVNRYRVWATYLLAWLVGSSAVAVRWWNLLAGPEWSWGHFDGSDQRYALKLYTTARNRLVADIEPILEHGPIDTIYRPSQPWGTPSADIIACAEVLLARLVHERDGRAQPTAAQP